MISNNTSKGNKKVNTLQKIISNTSTSSSTLVEKTCLLCQKKFIPKGRQKYCNDLHYKPCPVCGKPVPAPYPSDPAKCCSAECRRQLRAIKPAEPAPVKVIEESKPVESKPTEPTKKEYPLDPDIKLDKKPLQILEKGNKEFFIKQCIFDSKIKGLIKGHVYNIEVLKEAHTYQVSLTYDHTYREDVEIVFNIASAISFNNYFK